MARVSPAMAASSRGETGDLLMAYPPELRAPFSKRQQVNSSSLGFDAYRETIETTAQSAGNEPAVACVGVDHPSQTVRRCQRRRYRQFVGLVAPPQASGRRGG